MQKSSRSVNAFGRNRERDGHIDKCRNIDYAVPNSRPKTVRLKTLALLGQLKLGESISISNTFVYSCPLQYVVNNTESSKKV